jgi:hypothetical protein
MPTTTDNPQSSPPSSRSTPNRSSSYFTYPISYAVSGVLRRLNTDTSPKQDTNSSSRSLEHSTNSIQSQLQSTASSLSHSFASLVNSSTTSASDMYNVFQPPQRNVSPFQPPPLTPLTLKAAAHAKRANCSTKRSPKKSGSSCPHASNSSTNGPSSTASNRTASASPLYIRKPMTTAASAAAMCSSCATAAAASSAPTCRTRRTRPPASTATASAFCGAHMFLPRCLISRRICRRRHLRIRRMRRA